MYVSRRVPVSCQPIEDDDVDVACERRRVLRGDADNDMLKIDNLTKVYISFSWTFGQSFKRHVTQASLTVYMYIRLTYRIESPSRKVKYAEFVV